MSAPCCHWIVAVVTLRSATRRIETRPGAIHSAGDGQTEHHLLAGRQSDDHPLESHRHVEHLNENLQRENHQIGGHPFADRPRAVRRRVVHPIEIRPNANHPGFGDEMSHPRTGYDENAGNQP